MGMQGFVGPSVFTSNYMTLTTHYKKRKRKKDMSLVRHLLGHALPVSQQGDKVLAVVSKQIVGHLLANKNLRSLDDFTDGQRCVVVVVLVVDTVRVTSHNLFQQLHAHHGLPAEDGLHTGHSGRRTLIWTQRGEFWSSRLDNSCWHSPKEAKYRWEKNDQTESMTLWNDPL